MNKKEKPETDMQGYGYIYQCDFQAVVSFIKLDNLDSHYSAFNLTRD